MFLIALSVVCIKVGGVRNHEVLRDVHLSNLTNAFVCTVVVRDVKGDYKSVSRTLRVTAGIADLLCFNGFQNKCFSSLYWLCVLRTRSATLYKTKIDIYISSNLYLCLLQK